MKITPLEGAILANAVYGNDDAEFIEPEGYVLAKNFKTLGSGDESKPMI